MGSAGSLQCHSTGNITSAKRPHHNVSNTMPFRKTRNAHKSTDLHIRESPSQNIAMELPKMFKSSAFSPLQEAADANLVNTLAGNFNDVKFT